MSASPTRVMLQTSVRSNALSDDCNDLELSMRYELRALLFV